MSDKFYCPTRKKCDFKGCLGDNGCETYQALKLYSLLKDKGCVAFGLDGLDVKRCQSCIDIFGGVE